MEIRPFKIRDLTPEKSKIVQETLFKNGIGYNSNVTFKVQPMVALSYCRLYNCLIGWGSPSLNGFNEIKETELTFEEFERMYVKDEWWKTLKKGDVVKCIANPTNVGERKKGDIFTVTKDWTINGRIQYKEDCSTTRFEEFELVRRANEVEKWSVGTYVVFLIDYGYNNKGTISKITDNSTSIVEVEAPLHSDVNERCNLTKDRECKWFPTLKEAEEFSKQLLGMNVVLPITPSVGYKLIWGEKGEEEIDELPTFKPVVKNKNYFEKELDIN
jgi:hypothetical protein